MSIKRLNYFHYQFLNVDDFDTEQEYHIDMRRWHNKALHTYGIAEGLEVEKSGPLEVTIRPGRAIDIDGREIEIKESVSQDLKDIAGKTVYLYIAYKEEDTDLIDQEEASGYTRTAESYAIEMKFADSVPADWNTGLNLILAKVTFNPPDNEGNVTIRNIDSSERRQAGSKIGEAEFDEIKFKLAGFYDNKDWPGLTGRKLTDTGLQGIDVNSKNTLFTGGVKINEELEVSGNINANGVFFTGSGSGITNLNHSNLIVPADNADHDGRYILYTGQGYDFKRRKMVKGTVKRDENKITFTLPFVLINENLIGKIIRIRGNLRFYDEPKNSYELCFFGYSSSSTGAESWVVMKDPGTITSFELSTHFLCRTSTGDLTLFLYVLGTANERGHLHAAVNASKEGGLTATDVVSYILEISWS